MKGVGVWVGVGGDQPSKRGKVKEWTIEMIIHVIDTAAWDDLLHGELANKIVNAYFANLSAGVSLFQSITVYAAFINASGIL